MGDFKLSQQRGFALLDATDYSSDLVKEIHDAFDDGSEDIPLDDAFRHIYEIYLQDISDRI